MSANNNVSTVVGMSADEKKMAKSSEKSDPWALVVDTKVRKPWVEMNLTEKSILLGKILIKVIFLLGLLYMFICSLSFLADAFRLLGGKAAGEAFTNSDILSNPVANLMIGVLATVLLQSSSTTTSIVVAMVAAKLLTIRPAIFVVMGANIGTSVTNTIVSVGQVANRDEFRRAFAGATVHDMFNWLSVLCLLPIEWISGSFGKWKGCGFLCQITGSLTKNLQIDPNKATKKELLKAITKPFTKLVIQLDKKVITAMATNKAHGNESLIKKSCKKVMEVAEAYSDGNNTCQIRYVEKKVAADCGFMFESISHKWNDAAVGACLLILALGILCLCLVLIVKLLHSLLRGRIAKVLKGFINADFPGIMAFFTGYVAIALGAGLTMLVQSSSIFTSAITPLVGVGVLHIERMYPLTLGANIGTTITAILASLATEREDLPRTMQVALCHLFFNIFGIAIWYPFPFMRSIPITMAKTLGNTTAKYRWFAIFYLVLMFFLFPCFIFGLSVAGTSVLIGVGVPILVFFIIIVIINIMQKKRPSALPAKLRNWNFLPRFMRSLQPYDAVLVKVLGICKCRKSENHMTSSNNSEAVTLPLPASSKL